MCVWNRKKIVCLSHADKRAIACQSSAGKRKMCVGALLGVRVECNVAVDAQSFWELLSHEQHTFILEIFKYSITSLQTCSKPTPLSFAVNDSNTFLFPLHDKHASLCVMQNAR